MAKRKEPAEKAVEAQKQSRYQRVKAILNQAQGDFNASYQGYGRFWDLPLSEFLEVEIYGARMIAPWDEEEASTQADGCSCGEGCTCHSSASKPAKCKGRGAASGLIKGLKGEFPFDGTQFPPLMWGTNARRISDSDIRFIENWIDDCCPEDDAGQTEIEVREAQRVQRAYGDTEHPLAPQPLNAYRGDPGQLKIRKNIGSLSETELAKFRAAVAHMQSLNDYYQDERSFNYWARVHANMCEHGWELFLPWHRIYLYLFEKQLQDIDPDVTLPYWDWAMYADQNKQLGHDTGYAPLQYGCWIDDSGLANLNGKIPDETLNKLLRVKGQVFQSGNRLYSAVGIVYEGGSTTPGVSSTDDLIMSELQRINPLWHRQRWPGGDPILITHYPTPGDIDRILPIGDFAHFGGGPESNHYFGALESIHNSMHNFAGGLNPNFGRVGKNAEDFVEPYFGHMVEQRVTAFDPIFWGHHTNVDRLWARWQELHPNVNPQEMSAVLAPFEFTTSDAINMHDLGYEYMQASYHFPTDNTLGIRRFKSEKVDVSAPALQNHRRAEIRLHNVQIAQRSAVIRAFLNQPDATIDTPVENNDHYVGHFVTFVGTCYGGPGHCDVPAAVRPPYDLRMRHHKSPVNIRFDATEAVQKLAQDGQPQNFSVHLVVSDIEGKPGDDLLMLDGVSLNFVH